MKNNGSTTILNWALGLSMVALVWGGMQYFFKTRDVRSSQTQVQAQTVVFQNQNQILNNVIAECLEYSKKNPSIDAILEANNLKPRSGAAPAAKSTAK